ncbi:TadE family protein [Microbacterium sp. H1-D42]|uniref:TadE family protein n=1 Tax=Microbacterium sp. H1-D42 TaxID=2925844 RepID=UPI001F535873|nr:TadE family protein [Microbacterium sp. H1-D42]UNK71989.1 TadE family protein [Microbacterium sp. H1-D42]
MRSELSDETGSAALEFIVAGVLLLVPLVYLVLTLGAVQEQTLGAEAAARHTARVIGQAPDADSASASGDAVLASVIREYGMDADAVEVGITCRPAGAHCPEAGATVVVTVRTSVSLPFMPPLFGLDQVAAIPVEAQSAQKVSRLWGSG